MPEDLSMIRHNLKPEDLGMIFEAIMDRSKDGLFVVDQNGVVVMVNRATEKMCGFVASEVLGQKVKDLVEKKFYTPSVSLLVLEKKKAISLIQTTRINKKILSTGIPVFDADKKIRFVLVNDRDISFINMLAESLDADDISDAPVDFGLSDIDMAAKALEGVVVKSPVMEEVIKSAIRAAKFDIPLVLTGESGVGKSIIARLIHQVSERRNGPFVDLNCGAIIDTLLESELFGHEKGAFTGASPTGKKGLFEMADKGTLFLDEIGEVPLSLQVKLLKFLEKKEMVRVGGTRPVIVDTRIVAATNQDLEQMVKKGGFRSDLYFRLNVVPIEIPPLRQRREEIAPIAQFFLKKFNTEFNTRKILSKQLKSALSSYDFPGNVRELENLVKRLVTMSEGDYIRVKHLPAMIHEGSKIKPFQKRSTGHLLDEVAAFEQKLLMDAIKKHGSQRKAAKALGISQSTLSRKLKAGHPPHIIH